MASELVATLSTLNQGGLTVTARILGPTGTVLSSSVSCSETGTGTAVYVGNMPGGTAAGYLTVQFYSSTGPLLWVYQDYWTGTVWAGQQSSAFPTNFSLLSVDSNGRVDVAKVAGTAQTARDIGASVLLSSGTGTGQVDLTSGVIKANLTQILGTVLTETAGQIAAAFKQFFNIASPTSTMNTVTAVTTVTNLTNAPTSGDLTATMKASVTTAATAATPTAAAVTGNVGGNVVGSVGSVTARVTANTDQLAGQTVTAAAGVTFPTSVASPTNITFATGIVLAGVTHTGAVIPTVITYVGNTPQSGDAYARIGAAGAGLTAIGDTRMGNLDAAVSTRSTLTASAVYEELMAGHTTTGSYGEVVNWIMATLESAGVFKASALANAPTGGGGGGATAAEVWGYAGGRTLSTPSPTKEEIRAEIDANSTELAKIGTPANVTLAADIAALQAAGDPWLTDNLDTYPVGSAGAGMYRVVQTPGAGPVIVIPAPSATGKCVAFLNVLDLGDPAAVGAKIKIFPDPEPAAAGGFIIDPGRVDGYTILEIGDAGYGERELNVDPTSGTAYRFVCERLGLDSSAILVEGTFDISTLKVNPV